MIVFTDTGFHLDDLRATDFDVILVRSDLPPGQLRIIGSDSGNFDAALPLSVAGATVPFTRGWCAVDLDIRGRDVRVVNTGGRGAIEVVDTGPGIPPELMSRVFDRFFRVPGSNVRGSGLGLAIAQSAAQRCGLRISLRNREDRSGLVARVEFA